MKIVYRFLFVLLISMFLFGCSEKTSGIEGKIVDGKGQPLSGVSVFFKQVQPAQGYEQFETKTGADGVFRLTGFAPSSEYVITPASEKWKTKLTTKIKTLEAGQNLVLSTPIKIRFNQMKDGTIVDTKTGLQWKIYPVVDITAINVIPTVKGLKEAGFTDWRLPSRAELAGLQEETVAPSSPTAEPVLVNKTCCAWVAETNTVEVDWKFYVEDENELWTSSKESPDNRIIIVRNFTLSPAATAVPPIVKAEDGKAAVPATAIAPVTEAPKAIEAPASVKKEDKSNGAVRHASRKACAEKRAQAAKLAASKPAAPIPAETKVTPAPAASIPTAPVTASPKTAPTAPIATVAPKALPVAPTTAPKAAPIAAAAPKTAPAAPIATVAPKTAPLATTAPKAAPIASSAKIVDTTKKELPAKIAQPVKIADPVKSDSTVSLYYNSGSTTISAQELVKLKAFYAKFKNNKGTVVIDGHADASSSKHNATNLLLSIERSSNVVVALNRMGLGNKIKVEVRAMGDMKPAASNDSSEGRKLNRRVDVSFMPE